MDASLVEVAADLSVEDVLSPLVMLLFATAIQLCIDEHVVAVVLWVGERQHDVQLLLVGKSHLASILNVLLDREEQVAVPVETRAVGSKALLKEENWLATTEQLVLLFSDVGDTQASVLQFMYTDALVAGEVKVVVIASHAFALIHWLYKKFCFWHNTIYFSL